MKGEKRARQGGGEPGSFLKEGILSPPFTNIITYRSSPPHVKVDPRDRSVFRFSDLCSFLPESMKWRTAARCPWMAPAAPSAALTDGPSVLICDKCVESAFLSIQELHRKKTPFFAGGELSPLEKRGGLN